MYEREQITGSEYSAKESGVETKAKKERQTMIQPDRGGKGVLSLAPERSEPPDLNHGEP